MVYIYIYAVEVSSTMREGLKKANSEKVGQVAGLMKIINKGACSPEYHGNLSAASSFSLTSTSNARISLLRPLGSRLRNLILSFHSCMDFQLHLSFLSSLTCVATKALNCSLANIGAKDKKDKNTNLKMISGEVRRDETVWGVGDGVEATVCRMSPIWQVTAVQGKVPIKAPRMTSESLTPQTPQAMFIPDHGTTPMSRRTLRRTQADEVDLEVRPVESGSIADLVTASAPGKK
jgi:hypothetical protein